MKNHGGRLKDKVALVTGAATGIGEAIAHKFAKEGAKVCVAGRPDDPVDDVVERMRAHGAEAVGFRGDLGNEREAEKAVATTIEAFGRLDVLVNNAGAFPETGETQEFSTEAFEELVHNNIRTAFFVTKHALEHLQKTHGNIVCAGSEAGLIGIAEVAAYGATKGWMNAFAMGLAVEQAKHGVRVNAVCPGPIDTAWTHSETGPMSRQMERTMVQATPLGRRGTVEEVANVYAFLASDEASFITGALYTVDGGITVAKGPVGDHVPDELRSQPEGELSSLEHTHEGLSSLSGK